MSYTNLPFTFDERYLNEAQIKVVRISKMNLFQFKNQPQIIRDLSTNEIQEVSGFQAARLIIEGKAELYEGVD